MSYTSFVFQIEYGLTRRHSGWERINQSHTHTDSHFIMSCSSVPLLLWRFVFHISSSVQDLPHYASDTCFLRTVIILFTNETNTVRLLFLSIKNQHLNLTDDSLFNYSGFCPDRTLLIRSIWRKNISSAFSFTAVLELLSFTFPKYSYYGLKFFKRVIFACYFWHKIKWTN